MPYVAIQLVPKLLDHVYCLRACRDAGLVAMLYNMGGHDEAREQRRVLHRIPVVLPETTR